MKSNLTLGLFGLEIVLEMALVLCSFLFVRVGNAEFTGVCTEISLALLGWKVCTRQSLIQTALTATHRLYFYDVIKQ